MKRREFLKTAAAAAGLAILPRSVCGQAPATPAARTPDLTLRQAAGERMLIGCAVNSFTMGRPALASFIPQQFSCLTAENEMKPFALQRARGTFTFDRADRIVDFARAHNMQVIGHTLCWHAQSPRWMFQDESGQPLGREAALANLRAHIETVVRHFRGKVRGWDVVNEAINDDPHPDLRSVPARRAIGDDYILKAFEFAHAADPNVELYYNDYNIDTGSKRERALRLIRRIKQAGLRIDAVGIQGHWLLAEPSVAEIERGIEAFINERVKVHVTEMDIDVLPGRRGAGADVNARQEQATDPYRNGLPAEMQQRLAERYGGLFAMFMRHREVARVTMWGIGDGQSWLNGYPVRGRINHPLLFDRQLQPKPAYHAVIRALRPA
jgi:endo-1,4-beta-xylanase